MKRFKKLTLILLTIIFFVTTSNELYAKSNNIKVNIPDFNVYINDTLINNINNKYPLITYKNIVYIPITWSDSRFLGLETYWNDKTGLVVNKSNKFSNYDIYDDYINVPKQTYTAQKATFKITVNNKHIENNKEPYPLLVFRDTTYFPLTWRFAVDEFGWKYSFTKDEGLKIQSDNITDNKAHTILAIVNRTAFSSSYKIKSEIDTYYNAQRENRINTEGICTNEFKKSNLDNRDKELEQLFSPSIPIPRGSGAQLTGWSWNYNCEKPSENPGFGAAATGPCVSHSTFLSLGDGALTSINNFQILGDMRKSIEKIENTSNENDTYLITFNKDSKYANRKIELKINWDNLVLKTLNIKDGYTIKSEFIDVVN
ncbi:hypothetical protein [Tepidibacter hydrothermalis]|uniref:Copper amine oxidase-like N-terminal domain-containing protein n=1 Tax=Tepidibacter hydrothermalis TaxID=3036126 RepID=A0ABY8EJR7_9FIRM|nr:hypothetical protein [Tepidibacter hydrothermalis]WFD12430.1 hypothetical protein P4S50_20055 [Tepidibacter hydrothermalis]